MNQAELKIRTKRFALEVIRLINDLPQSAAGRTIAAQLVRSATSIGANYRAACRSRSDAEFISRIAIVEEEADESHWWLEILLENGTAPAAIVRPLLKEADELTAIFTAACRTAKRNARVKSEIRNPKSEIT